MPEFRANEALGLIRSGLRDFSVSRTSLRWGIPLPWDESVAYVWFDALTNYLAAVGYGTDDERFARWWPVDFHLIGKDIIATTASTGRPCCCRPGWSHRGAGQSAGGCCPAARR